MVLNSRLYDKMKWLGLIALPALGLFYSVIAPLWGLPYAEPITKTLDALGVLIGTLIGISSKNFYSQVVDNGQDGDDE